jgi:hypothetical protein
MTPTIDHRDDLAGRVIMPQAISVPIRKRIVQLLHGGIPRVDPVRAAE